VNAEEITRLKAGDTVLVSPSLPAGRGRRQTPFRVVLERAPSVNGGIVYLAGTRVRADGAPDKRARPGETYPVNAAWVEKTAPALVPEADRFRPPADVRIDYNGNPVTPYRRGWVIRDDGGPKVLVRWKAEDGPRIARNVVLYHGKTYEQWIPRERLTLR
jgi:hypothetical protein